MNVEPNFTFDQWSREALTRLEAMTIANVIDSFLNPFDSGRPSCSRGNLCDLIRGRRSEMYWYSSEARIMFSGNGSNFAWEVLTYSLEKDGVYHVSPEETFLVFLEIRKALRILKEAWSLILEMKNTPENKVSGK